MIGISSETVHWCFQCDHEWTGDPQPCPECGWREKPQPATKLEYDDGGMVVYTRRCSECHHHWRGNLDQWCPECGRGGPVPMKES